MKSSSSLCRMSLLAALGLGMPAWSWAQAAPAAGPGLSAPVADPSALTVGVALPVLEIPFAPAPADVAASVSANELLSEGRVALHAGLPVAAADCFRAGLAVPGLSGDLRDTLNLSLVTSYLAVGQFGNASAALKQVRDGGAPSAILRAALLAAYTQQEPEAVAQLARITPEQLTDEDRPWFFVVKAQVAEQDKDVPAAEEAWNRAVNSATAPFQRDEFQAAWWRAKTILGEAASPETESDLSKQMETFQGQTLGLEYALHLAVVRDKLGDHAGALKIITQLQATMSDDSPDRRDANNQVRLLLVELDEEDPANSDLQRDRRALQSVLQSNGNSLPHDQTQVQTPEERQTQEIALDLLGRNYQQDTAGLRDFVDKMINDAQEQGNPFLDRFYLLQGQLALHEYQSTRDPRQLDQAAASANQLNLKFPASPFREDAFRMLAYIAFKNPSPEYRNAATYLSTLLGDPGLTDNAKRLGLSKLIADLDFLNQDYRHAADTYEPLLAALPPGPLRGTVLFDAVESELRDGQHEKDGPVDDGHLTAAEAILDKPAISQNIEPLDRWRAEWNLLGAMRNNGRDAAAFARLKHLLDPDSGAGAPPDQLRLRLLWLDARLAVDIKDASASKKAQAFQDAVTGLTEQDLDENGQPLAAEFTPTALLLLGQAASLNNQPDQEKRYFDDLRNRYRSSDAAAFSSMFEANALAVQEAYPKAEEVMKELYEVADQKLNPKFAPLAMYYAASYAIAQGSSQYDDAMNNILQKFITLYPHHELVYRVQMLEAYIKDKQYDFTHARDLYKLLLDPGNPLSPQVKTQIRMAYATCLATDARLSNDAKERQDAVDELERLFTSKDLPAEASVEVAFEYGYLLEHGTEQGKGLDLAAAKMAFLAPVTHFLNSADPVYADDLRRSVNGPLWLSKCLFELAAMDEQQQPSLEDEARHFYSLVIQLNLPSASFAKAHLDKPPAPSPASPTASPPPDRPATSAVPAA